MSDMEKQVIGLDVMGKLVKIAIRLEFLAFIFVSNIPSSAEQSNKKLEWQYNLIMKGLEEKKGEMKQAFEALVSRVEVNFG